jgi:hypothetical protein
MKYPIIICALIIAIAVIVSCKKSKPELPEITAPCELDKPIEAGFWIGQSMNYHDPCGWAGNDTIIPRDYGVYNQGGFLYFTADTECYDELEWIIGNDPQHRFGKQIYVQFFSADVSGSTIPITLIARKEPNLLCYPNDDGVDTLVRNIYFDTASTNVYGNFEGYNIGEDANDPFVIWIKDFTGVSSPPQFSDLIGLPRGCTHSCNSHYVVNLLGGAHRIASFCGNNTVNGTFWDCPSTTSCPHIEGVIEYSADYDTVTIAYDYAYDPSLPNNGSNSIEKIFVGVRQ